MPNSAVPAMVPLCTSVTQFPFGPHAENTVIDNITAVENKECERRKGIVVYFAKKGDVLWDIAKKYSTSCENIAMHNNLEEDKITQGTKIFIPSC